MEQECTNNIIGTGEESKTFVQMKSQLHLELLSQLREDLVYMTKRLFELPLTVEQTATILGTTSGAIYKRISREQLNSSIIDGHVTITMDEILQKYKSVKTRRGRKANE